jgi:hypothetical protein
MINETEVDEQIRIGMKLAKALGFESISEAYQSLKKE